MYQLELVRLSISRAVEIKALGLFGILVRDTIFGYEICMIRLATLSILANILMSEFCLLN